VTEICELAAESGILTVIDGAHAQGQIPIDMEVIGADFYFGNAHKWMCSPKGAGFLFTRPEKQYLIEPLVVGWGWGEDREVTFGSDYLDYMQWLGTNDLAAYLAVPAAIEFHEANDWSTVRQECHKLLKEAIHEISNLTDIPPCYPDSSYYCQMAVARLPQINNLTGFKDRLYNDFRVEIPCIQWQDQQFIRISIQGYNTRTDVDGLIEALRTLIPVFQV
jgi:isopenicillin-N epimerase